MNIKITEVKSADRGMPSGYEIVINGQVHRSSPILEGNLRAFKRTYLRDFKAKFIKSVANEYYNAIMKLGDPS